MPFRELTLAKDAACDTYAAYSVHAAVLTRALLGEEKYARNQKKDSSNRWPQERDNNPGFWQLDSSNDFWFEVRDPNTGTLRVHCRYEWQIPRLEEVVDVLKRQYSFE